MLFQLEIKNIALIDEVSVEFGRGLNILTGETGAGKSIIIDSINMLLGERFSRDLIRSGENNALIEAVLEINNKKMEYIYDKYGINPEKDGTLVISREFSISGRSICRVNGRLVTVTALKDIGGYLIDVHGQYDNQSLLKSETHIELLDLFGGEKIRNLKENYIKFYNKRKEIKNNLYKFVGKERDRERKIDLLKYQINEIKSAKLTIGEEETLEKQRKIYLNAGKIIDTLASAYSTLFSNDHMQDSIYDVFNDSISKLNTISNYNEKYKNIVIKLENISYLLEDLKEEIRNERDSIEYNPHLLEKAEERLDLIYNLKKKYGDSISDILIFCEDSEIELESIIKSEEYINNLQKELLEIEKELLLSAKNLNKERIRVAKILADSICDGLKTLEMGNVSFEVDISMEMESGTQDEEGIKFKSNGLDRVEFLISPNIGEPLKSLSRIASGGEMARIMLAIKAILADADKIPTLIFDEIDIGISGKGSQKVGEKLALLSKSHQVICVTHQAQIASMAKNHYLIEKLSSKTSTKTKITKLSEEKRLNEIARILGGDTITDRTKNLAQEMIDNGKKYI